MNEKIVTLVFEGHRQREEKLILLRAVQFKDVSRMNRPVKKYSEKKDADKEEN